MGKRAASSLFYIGNPSALLNIQEGLLAADIWEVTKRFKKFTRTKKKNCMNTFWKELFPISVLIAVAVIIFWGLGNALFPLFAASTLAYLLFPIIKRLERKGVKRGFAIASTLCAALLTGAIILFFVVPVLMQDFREFLTTLPKMAENALVKIETYANEYGYSLPINKENLIAEARAYLSGFVLGNLKSIGLFFGKAFSGIAGLLLSALNLILIPVLFIYLITDYERIANAARSFIPTRSQAWFDSFTRRSTEIISAYFKGQLLVAMILGVLYGTGFMVAGLRFGFIVGLLTGFLNLIPFAGPIIGVGIASTIAIADFGGYGPIIGVWVVFAIVQGLESFVITPKIVGDRVGLNALETMLALIIGGNLTGFFGMLVAIPAGGITKIIIRECKEAYLKSSIYKGESCKLD